MCKFISRFVRATTHTCATAFILVLPFGYYTGQQDSTDIAFGVQGGTGQVAAVIRDCNDNPVASSAADFGEVSASAAVRVNNNEKVGVWLSATAGHYGWNNASIPGIDSLNDLSHSDQYASFNFSVEGPAVGAGVGVVAGDVPLYYSDYYDTDYLFEDHLVASGHIRFGYLDNFYFLASLAERQPMLTTGPLQIGMGYRLSDKVSGFSGVSAFWYDRGGFLQTLDIRLNRRLRLETSLRLGEAADQFEGSISAGLVYGVSFRKR